MTANWTILDQSREAAIKRLTAKLDSIFERGREEARCPTNPVLRAWNDANYANQQAGGPGLDLCEGMVEARRACGIHWSNKAAAE